MTPSLAPATLTGLARMAHATPGLQLLLLFGSRARGEARPDSDWDFGYLAEPNVDLPALLSAIIDTVGSDRVDLVDLSRAGGLLRFRAARDGRVIMEARSRLGEQFCLDAAQFWCDAAPVLERGYDQVLADLSR